MIHSEHFIRLLAGRHLGGLDAPESLELDRHLAGCATCVVETRAFERTMADLALVVDARRPPERFHASIITAIRSASSASDPSPRHACVVDARETDSATSMRCPGPKQP